MFCAGGVQVINGGFYQHFRDMSAGARVKRGYPIETKQLSKDEVPVQRLSSSTFYWLDGGVRGVTGRINSTYQAQGAETGRLGFPTASVRKGGGDTWYSTFEGGRLTVQTNGTVSASYR